MRALKASAYRSMLMEWEDLALFRPWVLDSEELNSHVSGYIGGALDNVDEIISLYRFRSPAPLTALPRACIV